MSGNTTIEKLLRRINGTFESNLMGIIHFLCDEIDDLKAQLAAMQKETFEEDTRG